jgi:hypothetical protein
MNFAVTLTVFHLSCDAWSDCNGHLYFLGTRKDPFRHAYKRYTDITRQVTIKFRHSRLALVSV